ncbi:MAG: hypothetical protein RLO01_12765 [Thalassobaculaceae bacterium]
METKSLPLSSLKLGGHVAADGHWNEHDLASFATLIAKKYALTYPGKRICFDVDVSRIPSRHGGDGYHPVIVTESVPGYHPTTFDIGSSLAVCRANVALANAVLGLSSDDVDQIIGSSIDAQEKEAGDER